MLVERWRIARERHPFYACAFAPAPSSRHSARALVGGCEWYGHGVLLVLDDAGQVAWEAWQPVRPAYHEPWGGVTSIAVDPSGELALCACMQASRRRAPPALYRIGSAEPPTFLVEDQRELERPFEMGHSSGAALVDGALWIRRIASDPAHVVDRVELPADVATFARTDRFTSRRIVARAGLVATAMRKRDMSRENGTTLVRDEASGALVLERYPDDGALLLVESGARERPRIARVPGLGEITAMIAGGEHIAVGTAEGAVGVVDWAGNVVDGAPGIAAAHREPIEAICFLGDGETLVTGSRGGDLALWSGGRELARVDVDFSVRALAADPRTNRLFVAGKSMRDSRGVAVLYDVAM